MQVLKNLIFCLLVLKSKRKLADLNNVSFDPLEIMGKEGQMPMIKQEVMPVVIFELGNLVCYTYQTAQENLDKKLYESVYWKFKDSNEHNGPFPNIYSAMKHYTHILQTSKVISLAPMPKGNVIEVDFKAKRRV